MSTNELALLGKALQALFKVGAVEEVKEIVNDMADLGMKPLLNKPEPRDGND
jgi:hypothetical protein